MKETSLFLGYTHLSCLLLFGVEAGVFFLVGILRGTSQMGLVPFFGVGIPSFLGGFKRKPKGERRLCCFFVGGPDTPKKRTTALPSKKSMGQEADDRRL